MDDLGVKLLNNEKKPSLRLIGELVLGGVIWLVLYLLLQPLSEWLTYHLLGFSRISHLGSAVSFFIFEVPKVLMLLVLIVFGVGIIQTFVTPEKTRQILAGNKESLGNILAALLGIVTPFCSCSAIPLFLGFVEAGVPLGVTLSFLISAPMINEIALVLLLGMFGWKVALVYVSTGLCIAIISGWIIGRLHLEKYVENWVYEVKMGQSGLDSEPMNWNERIQAGLSSVKEIVGKIWLYIILGILVGAGIHGYVPEGLLASFMGKSAWWSVPLAVLLGVPMYSNAAGIIPIVHALLEKGAALGTVLAFMMSVIGLSLPETIILKKVLKLPLILIFVGIVSMGIMTVGFLFNYLF